MDKSRDRFELILEETLRSLEQIAIKFMLKAKQNIFNKADKSRDRFELILEETLRSLEEIAIKFVLKAEQQKAIEWFYKKQIF